MFQRKGSVFDIAKANSLTPFSFVLLVSFLGNLADRNSVSWYIIEEYSFYLVFLNYFIVSLKETKITIY